MSDHLYLAHHGIKGQKWGVRRFQNEDGSLTSAGEKRYGEGGDRKRNNLAKNVEASRALASASGRMAKRAEARAANSKNAIVRGLNKIEARHQRHEQKRWQDEAAVDKFKLDQHDRKVAKKRRNLELNVEASKTLAEANRRRVDKALKKAGSTKIGMLAPGLDIMKKGAYHVEAMQARGQQRMWEKETAKDQRRLERFNARHS